MPGELKPFAAAEGPRSPALAGADGCRKALTPWKERRSPLRGRDILGGVIQSSQRELRGAGDKGSGGVWEVSFPSRIISHKLCQLPAVKKILEISTFPIWRERQRQLPLVLLSWELQQTARGDCLGFF